MIIDPAHAYAPLPGAGARVMGWSGQDHCSPFRTQPPELAREIRRRFGVRPIGYEIPVRKLAGDYRRARTRILRSAQLKGELTTWMMERGGWDLLLTVFGEPHRGGHLLWPDPGRPALAGALLDVYRALDAALADVLATARRVGADVWLFASTGWAPIAPRTT